MHHADIHGFNVHFAHRLDNRRWAMLIRPLSRADPVRKRHPRQTTIWCGIGQLTNRRIVEIDNVPWLRVE